MALTKDQYERLIAAAERIAMALEQATPAALTAEPEPPTPTPAEPASPAPAASEALVADEPPTSTAIPADEQPATPAPDHDKLNTWLYQAATYLSSKGRSGVADVTGVLQKHGLTTVYEVADQATADAVVAEVNALMQGVA